MEWKELSCLWQGNKDLLMARLKLVHNVCVSLWVAVEVTLFF